MMASARGSVAYRRPSRSRLRQQAGLAHVRDHQRHVLCAAWRHHLAADGGQRPALAQDSKSTTVAEGLAFPRGVAFDADGNLLLEPTSPNANQTFEFTLTGGSTQVIVAPDPGRALITGDPNDALNFKIPTLWGIKDTAPYFHDNSARTLEAVLNHYNRLFEFINDQAPDLLPLMTEQDQTDIIAFLKLL
jgi:cytochrome c peroxidase